MNDLKFETDYEVTILIIICSDINFFKDDNFLNIFRNYIDIHNS